MGDVGKAGKIEIEGNGEKIQINTIVHRGEGWVGLKHPVKALSHLDDLASVCRHENFF